jgi:hypothetical protein
MILKRSDKLIAIIGVIILIVAGIGIFFYISDESDTDETQDSGSKNKFIVEWIEEDQIEILDKYAGRGADYSEEISNTITKEPVSVLLRVDLRVTWADTQNYGMFFRNGLFKVGADTLSAEFTYVGDTKNIPAHQSGGNKSVEFTIYDKPIDQIMEDINDYNEAVQKIKDDYMDMDTAIIEAKVMITPGERFGFRPLTFLRYLRDSGENFELEITYTYCYPVITPVEEDNEPPVDLNPSGYQSQSYSKMCLPGML